MKKNTIIANGVTVVGTMGMLAIAGFSAPVTAAISIGTIAGCAYLTSKENKKEGK